MTYGEDVFWECQVIPGREGIYIGKRTLSNGIRVWEGAMEEFSYSPSIYFGVALVVFSPRENPVYVPLDCLQELDDAN